MDKFIDKVYIIDKDFSRVKNKLKKNYKRVGLDITSWESIKSDKFSDKKMKQKTNFFCNNFCTTKTLDTWFSHYYIWKSMVKYGENNVLIIEDNTRPVKNFKKKFLNYSKEIPKDYDIIFLGCNGTCKKFVGLNEKISEHLYKPKFPTGTYGYLISYNGAKKLINSGKFYKAKTDLDIFMNFTILRDNKYNIYAFLPPLIEKTNIDDTKIKDHQLIDNLQNDLGNYLAFINKEAFNIRSLNLNISIYSLILFLISLILGYHGNKKIINNFLVFSLFLALFETAYTKINNLKIRSLMFEFFMILLFVALGLKLRKLNGKNSR